MDSDLQQQQQQQQPMNTSRLMRYRSAPSSYFAALLESGGGGENCDEFLNPRPTSPETERILARFISSGGTEDLSSHGLCDVRQNASETLQPQFGATMKHETDLFHHQEEEDHQQQQNSGFSSASQMPFQNQSLPSLPNPNSGMDSSYRVMGSTQMEHLIRGGGNSNLIRHSSSPAGLFSHINIENGYGVMRGMGSFGGTNAEESFPSPSRLKGPIDFSSGPPSSSGQTNLISENRSKSMEMGGPEDGSFGESQRNDRGGYIAGFPIGSWDDSTILSDSFLNDDRKTFSGMSASENQNAEGGNRPTTMLSHHLSLPKSSAELSAMEKLLQFQDSVPCKIRAKRGCATHPRSIAERVRRTRISERMRKLQELVPNMDKQTNTADMLDLAVDYIKDLQKQVKTLVDQRAKCTCSDNQRS